MHNKIIDFLKRKHEYVSGEEISSHLKVSRQALWKHIEALRDSGYEIVAVPHLGYKLVSVPDRLFPSEIEAGLKTKFIGKKIYYFDSIASTMDMAMQLGMKQATEGTIVLSEAQHKGRGRMGRDWASPKYKGIYMSLILRPEVFPGQLPILTLLAAVSICEAIGHETGLEVKIKWPNDIFIHNKKLGGILTELSAEADEVRFVAIGIGLNVNNDKKSLVSGATSVREEKGEAVSRISLFQEILRRIEENYLVFQKKGPNPVTDKWRQYNITLGMRVRVAFHKHHLEGEASDIDSDGALLVRKDSGIVQKVTAGDVVHCR
ncbi:MAG: biotin--[acetyl-CoA-carboxylase] ligase [Candidatus Omnitrophota bacterium]